MKLTKCPNNHYYNADKLPYCPHCINYEAGISVQNPEGLDQKDVATSSVTHQITDDNPLQRKTIGWLVCLKGNMQGESFILYDSKNYIGRSHNMNICLSKEPTVSRENHACITYHAKTNTAAISSGAAQNHVLLNDAPLSGTAVLSDRSLIQLGDCMLLFVALCNETFIW